MKTNFKLHLVTSKDKIRPAMNSVLINRDEAVATDAHVLARVPVSSILDLDSIALIPEKGILIDAQIWKAIHNADSIHLKETAEGLKIVGYFSRKPVQEYKVQTNGEGTTFPNYRQVIPDHEHAKQETSTLKLNPKLLENLRQAIDATAGVQIQFNGHNKGAIVLPILERGKEEDTAKHGSGLIMLMML